MDNLSGTELHIQVVDDECLETNEDEQLRENLDVLGDEILEEDRESIVPTVGMKFKSVEEIFDFYKKYAYDVGFPVRRRTSKKGEDGVINFVMFSCSREGQKSRATSSSSRPQPTIQIGCKARISASCDMYGIWRINTVHLDHNHKTSPSKSRLFRCNRELSANVKRQLEMNDIAGIPLHKSYNAMVIEAGGYNEMTCIERDCRNFVQQARRLRLGEGDAAAIQSYFSRMQANCPGFFFSIDLDEECRLRNMFWADNRCREAYKEFGDVLTFDTTYLTNKYDMPFAPFVGVNHHGQSMLFGCALLSHEDTETFVWLFSTWLQCMQGRAPNGIITDQDRAMQNAIHIVFPNTKHRWCLWHILKKLPEKFGHHVEQGAIFSAIHRLVYDSQTPLEFDQGWMEMVQQFELHDNNWLSTLYVERGRWIPCFLKTSFWAGMSTTQRSESMNAFFDGFVHSKTTLKQFVEQYEHALTSKIEKEFQADFRSFSQMVPCITPYGIEKQFQSVYTISKFKEVQEEITGRAYCQFIAAEEGYMGTTYEVEEDVVVGEGVKRKKFTVSFHRTTCDFVCSCHLFEFRGIICRHAISILIRNRVESIPEKYILRRWRRDVTRGYTRVAVNCNGWNRSADQLRYDELCRSFTEVANLAANDEGSTAELLEWSKNKKEELVTLKPCSGSNRLSQSNDQVDSTSSGRNILDPTCSITKGRPKQVRRKGPLETSRKVKVSSGTKQVQKRSQQNVQAGGVVIHSTGDAQYPVMMPLPYPPRVMVQDGTQAGTLIEVNELTSIPQHVQYIQYGQGGPGMHYYMPYMQHKDGTGS